MISTDLAGLKNLDLMGEVEKQLEADLRQLFAEIHQAIDGDSPEVTGETRASWAPFGGSDLSAVRERAEGDHEPLKLEAVISMLESWTLGKPLGVGSDHPAMQRIYLGLSNQAKLGWVEAAVKKVVAMYRRRNR